MELLTVAEAAQIVRRPEATLRFWRHQGEGPHSFKIGRRVMYRREDVENWLQTQYEAGVGA